MYRGMYRHECAPTYSECLLVSLKVFKTGVTHYFSLDKARRDFGYEPQPRDLAGVVQWYRDRGRGRSNTLHTTASGQQRSTRLWLLLLKALLCLAAVALLTHFL